MVNEHSLEHYSRERENLNTNEEMTEKQLQKKKDITINNNYDPLSIVEPILWTLLSFCPVVSLWMLEIRGHGGTYDSNTNTSNNSKATSITYLTNMQDRWTMCIVTFLRSLVTLVQIIKNPGQTCDKNNGGESFNSNNTTINALWRQQPKKLQTTNKDPQGICSIVLIPLLLQSMSLYNEHWLWYAKLASVGYAIIPPLAKINPYQHTNERLYDVFDFMILLCCATLIMDGEDSREIDHGGSVDTSTIMSLSLRRSILQTGIVITTMLIMFPYRVIQTFVSFQRVFTISEWFVVSSLCSIAISEIVLLIIDFAIFQTDGVVIDSNNSNHDVITGSAAGIAQLVPSIPGCISLSGVLGSILGCVLASVVPKFMQKIPVLVVTPFLIIEYTLHHLSPYYYKSNTDWDNFTIMAVPKSLQWLVSFLLEKEIDYNNNDMHTGAVSKVYQSLPCLQYRYRWLIYWIFILAIAIPCAPRSSKSANAPFLLPLSSVVARRKWFHGVAVLLFGPVTWYSPQLMSLSYAIALAVLFVMEHIRLSFRIPIIDEFYTAFLDLDKDTMNDATPPTTTTTTTTATRSSKTNTNDEKQQQQQQQQQKQQRPPQIVVTHMLLIVGCALPLWISEIIQLGHRNAQETPINTVAATSASNFFVRLVQLWGVLSLGVGDAMGALVGKAIGKIYWNPHRGSGRTLEGSFAMWMSMSIICYLCQCTLPSDSPDKIDGIGRRLLIDHLPWLAAVTGVTFIEAWTHQIDNLILPLTGVIILLTFQPLLN